jgi:ferric-chelate reductase
MDSMDGPVSSAIPSGMMMSNGQLNTSYFDGNISAGYDFLQSILDFDAFNGLNQYYGNVYWIVVGSVIGGLAVTNFCQRYLSMTAEDIGAGLLVRPFSFFNGILDRQLVWSTLPLKNIAVIAVYFGLVMCVIFIDAWTAGFQQYASIGFRAGWIAAAQLPLVVLLAGKKNIIGYLTGTSYERLNYLHRWVARIIFVCATIHMISMYRNFLEFGFTAMEWQTDTCPPTGTAAWVLLFWIVLSSLSPVRNLRYEIFVAQHVISYMGFIIAVIMHIQPFPQTIWVYAYIPCGLFVVDRLIRLAFYIRGTSKASLHKLGNELTLVTVKSNRLRSWEPGQFVLLSIPKLGIFQSHPFTISNLPNSDNEMRLICKRKGGFTKALNDFAETASNKPLLSFIDGPYGDVSKLQMYENLVLVVGGTAISFAMPVLSSIVLESRRSSIATRNVTLIWAVRSVEYLDWAIYELHQLKGAGTVEVKVQIFLTTGEAGEKGKSRIGELPDFVTLSYGRPQLSEAIPLISSAESAFAVAGPDPLQLEVRNYVSELNLARARYGSIPSVHLHVERHAY